MKQNTPRHPLDSLRWIAVLLQYFSSDLRSQSGVSGQSGYVPNRGRIMQPGGKLNNLNICREGFGKPSAVLNHDGQMLIEEPGAKCIPAAVALI